MAQAIDEKAQPFLPKKGFFQKLFGGGGADTDGTFYAVQVVFDAAGQQDLRRRIQELLDGPEIEDVDEKRRFYKRLTGLLREAEPFYDFAWFEHVVGMRDAEPAFEQWASEIEASLATEDEEVGDEVDGYHRLDSDQRYIVVSLLALFEGKHPFYGSKTSTMGEIFTRAGVGDLLEGFNMIPFDRLVGDAAFLVPGSEEDGFSWADFADEGWKYLQPLNT